MSAQASHTLSEADYLAFEREATQRHEFYAGRILALAGGSANHNQIIINTIVELRTQTSKGACRIYSSDMRIKIPATKSYLYPDIALVCGIAQYADEAEDLLLNPVIVIEVLSPSTERYDRGKKFEIYRTITSLQEYVLIAQEQRRVDHFIRQSDALWTFVSMSHPTDALVLASAGCTLRLETIYEDVTFKDLL